MSNGYLWVPLRPSGPGGIVLNKPVKEITAGEKIYIPSPLGYRLATVVEEGGTFYAKTPGKKALVALLEFDERQGCWVGVRVFMNSNVEDVQKFLKKKK